MKRIDVTEEAYRRLMAHKTADESLSDVILRLARRRPLARFAGILREESAEAVRQAIDDDRERRRKVDERR